MQIPWNYFRKQSYMYSKEHDYYWGGGVQMGGTNVLPIQNGC